MAFIPDEELKSWASPKEFDAVLLKNARLEAKLESHTSPAVWMTLGAIAGVLYYVGRQSLVNQQFTRAVENAFI